MTRRLKAFHVPLLWGVAWLVWSGMRPPDEFERLAADAGAARQSGDLLKAIALYERALQHKADWDEGWWYLGTLSYDLDRYEAGRDAFRQLVRLVPESAPGWALLGLCEFQTREYERALASLHQGRTLGLPLGSKLYYVASYHTALLLNRIGQFEHAIDILHKLALNHPENPKLIEAFGISLLRLPFLPAELPPDRREAVLLAGQAGNYWSTNRLEKAAGFYDQLVQRYPSLPNAHYARGVYLLLKDPDAAVEEFRRELEISPDHVPARLQLAFEYIQRGQPEQGLPLAREAVEIDPGSFAARNALGRILLALGQVDDSIRELEKGLELAPDSPEMYFALAQAYTKAGRAEEARAAREEFRRRDEIRRQRKEGIPSSPAAQSIPEQSGGS